MNDARTQSAGDDGAATAAAGDRPRIVRYIDWPGRLEAAVRSRVRTPFGYGAHDCCLAACACVEAMTGVDLAAVLRGYGDRARAESMIARHGGFLPMLRAMAAQHGLAEVPPAFAQRGDLAYWNAAGEGAFGGLEFLGLVWLDGKSVFIADRVGWDSVRLRACQAAWRVG